MNATFYYKNVAFGVCEYFCVFIKLPHLNMHTITVRDCL